MKFLRDLFFRDFWLKLFSLALAITLWQIVSLAIEKEVSPSLGEPRVFDSIPVLVMSSAADAHAYRVTPSQVQVSVKGDSDVLDKLLPEDIRAVVDLTGIESAQSLQKRIEILPPPGVTWWRASPEVVQVVIPQRH